MAQHKHHDAIVAYANGKPLQYFVLDKNPQGMWRDYWENSTPNFDNNNITWRVKPNTIKKWQWLYKFSKIEDSYILSIYHYSSKFELVDSLEDLNLNEDYEIIPCLESEIEVEIFDN